MSDKFTINIPKSDRFATRVPVPVNGQVAYVPVGEDTEVGEHIVSALSGAGVQFTTVSAPAETGGSGSGVGSEPSTTIQHTALQQEPVNEDIYTGGTVSSALTEPNQLGTGAAGSATGESGDGTGYRTDEGNKVEVNEITGDGATATGEDGESGARTEREGDPAPTTIPNPPKEQEQPASPAPPVPPSPTETPTEQEGASEPGPLDQSVEGLTEHLKTVGDEATIRQLIKQETAGKSRVGALKALESRLSELTAQ